MRPTRPMGPGYAGDPPHPAAGPPGRGGQAHRTERIDEKLIYHARASWADTTACSSRRARSSRPSPASRQKRCAGARNAASAAAASAAQPCGWKSAWLAHLAEGDAARAQVRPARRVRPDPRTRTPRVRGERVEPDVAVAPAQVPSILVICQLHQCPRCRSS